MSCVLQVLRVLGGGVQCCMQGCMLDAPLFAGARRVQQLTAVVYQLANICIVSLLCCTNLSLVLSLSAHALCLYTGMRLLQWTSRSAPLSLAQSLSGPQTAPSHTHR